MIHEKLTGLVLGMKAFSEFDRVIIFFSEEHGLVPVLAKGVRRTKSRRAFHLDILNYLQLEVEESSAPGSPRYLREVTTLSSFGALKLKPHRYAAACLAASFLNIILPQGTAQPELWHETRTLFEALEHGSETKEELLRSYFLKAAKMLGYLPNRTTIPKDTEWLLGFFRELDPQFTLRAHRTLGIFSNFESTRSS